MRIKLVSLEKSSANQLNADLLSTIANSIGNYGEYEIVTSQPDLVHVFASWNATTERTIKKFKNKGIPVVLTSINGLADLLASPHPLHPYAFHCCGPSEAKLIKRVAPEIPISIIACPLFTSTTDTNRMLKAISDLYNNVYDAHDTNVKERIQRTIDQLDCNDNTIKRLCSLLLYLQYSYKREVIRQSFLNEIASEFIHSDYDEDIMRQALDALKIYEFSASAMALLEQLTPLTEGFMPIPASTDKLTDKMQKLTI